MSQWVKVPQIGGVVTTGPDVAIAHLANGELISSAWARLKPNEPDRVYPEVGYDIQFYLEPGVIAGPFRIDFENAVKRIMVVRTVDDSTELVFLNPLDGTVLLRHVIQGVATNATVAHRGDEYYVGTDVGNLRLYLDGFEIKASSLGMSSGTISGGVAGGGVHGPVIGGSQYKQGDIFLYFVTEYDDTADVESGPVLVDSYPRYLGIGVFGTDDAGWEIRSDRTTALVVLGSNKVNSRTTKYRIYRRYLGNTSTDEIEPSVLDDVRNGTDLRGGRLAEVETNSSIYTDTFESRTDPSVTYPQIVIANEYALSFYTQAVQPEPFTVAAVFNDALVTNAPNTSKQVIKFSPPGQPEYQPTPYFMYFATDRSDEIVGMHVLNNTLLVLLRDSVQRVNYLPFSENFSANLGRVQDTVVSSAGCVSRTGHVVVETPSGRMMVWVSTRGLEMSNGVGWDDACPDFKLTQSATELAQVTLVNNERLYRLELFVGTEKWDFYYHPSLLKNGRFRVMGPTPMPVAYIAGAVANNEATWIGHAAGTTKVSNEEGQQTMDLQVGQIYNPENPFVDVEVSGVAAIVGGVGTMTVRMYGTDQGQAENPNPTQDSGAWSADGFRVLELWERGKMVRVRILAQGQDWSIGPFYYRVGVSGADVS